MATAPVSRVASRLAGFAAALVMVAVIAGISFTGRWPSDSKLVRAPAKGILFLPAGSIGRVEINVGDEVVAFEHGSGAAWTINGVAIAPAIAKHVDDAVRFLNVSPPNRVLRPGEYDADKIAEFGLDPPRMLVSLFSWNGKTASVTFGEPTPAENSQYVRVIGRPIVYLLSRFVGVEWQVAMEMAERAAPGAAADGKSRPAAFLLPVSFASVWAVEVVENGVLTRFERDPAGDWFHHVGQHVHKPGGFVHTADPKLAPLIAAELAGLERASVEKVVAKHPGEERLAEFGLEHPSSIMVLYTRDSSDPVARLEFGRATEDGFARYARVRETDIVVTVPLFAAAHVSKLLQLAGVRS